MRTILRACVILLGVCLGAYMGIYWSLFGGFIDVVTACKQVNISFIAVTVGTLKMILSPVVSMIFISSGVSVGMLIYQE